MKDFNTISLYGCPMEPNKLHTGNTPLQFNPPPPQSPTLDIKHASHALLRLYGFALEGAKPDQRDELLEHFRTLGKALGVM